MSKFTWMEKKDNPKPWTGPGKMLSGPREYGGGDTQWTRTVERAEKRKSKKTTNASNPTKPPLYLLLFL
jgi:hypothetical protein